MEKSGPPKSIACKICEPLEKAKNYIKHFFFQGKKKSFTDFADFTVMRSTWQEVHAIVSQRNCTMIVRNSV